MNPEAGPKDKTIARSVEGFEKRFGNNPTLYRAPGRVNLIGEHTDYNDGYVMPAAIGFYAHAAISPRDDRELHIFSENFGNAKLLNLDSLAGAPTGHWSDYVRGVAAVLQSTGLELRGANLVVSSEVPIGAGLSSSAALEVATAMALLGVSGLEMPLEQLAKNCQRAENEYTGARCGIMDQFISCFARALHALMLDCRSLARELLPISDEAKIVVCNTKVKHNLAGGEYNQRRAGCEASVRHLQRSLPGIRALRDVTIDQLKEFGKDLPPEIFRLAHHVISENARVLTAGAALKSSDLGRFGMLMYESHRSLRDDYRVSCKELDVMVELASSASGVFGARMTGGGFGGCTVNLVQRQSVPAFVETIAAGYLDATGIKPEVYVCDAADGASKVII
jgi:galactokinase